MILPAIHMQNPSMRYMVDLHIIKQLPMMDMKKANQSNIVGLVGWVMLLI